MTSRPFSSIFLSAERELAPIRIPVQVKKPFALDVGRFSIRPGTTLSIFVAGADFIDSAGALIHPVAGWACPRKLITDFGGSEHGTLCHFLILRKSVRPIEILLTLSIVPLQFLDYNVLLCKVGCLEGFVAVRSGRLNCISIYVLLVYLYIIHFSFKFIDYLIFI